MKYLVVGYPKMYDMQYGIYDYRIAEGTYEEMCDIGYNLSREVIEEFCHPSEEWYTTENYLQDTCIDFWKDEYEEAYNSALENIIENEIAFRIWKIKPDTTEENIRLWANSDDDIKEFVEHYCIMEGEI